jgi:cell division transport system permease protein
MRKEVIKLMKAFRILGRSIRDAVKSVVRNFSLSIASILCVTITLILVSVSIIISANINNTTRNIEDELNIVVYVNKNATDEQVNQVKDAINKISKVQSVEYKSKAEWKSEMMDYSDTFKTVLNYLDDNPLMDSFTVKVNNVKDLSEVAKYIKTIDNVETVKYGEGMVESIVSAFDVVQKVTVIIVIALVIVTAFLISNTIKLTIFSRRNEIEIMRLVGASNSSIKLPFIFEGFIIGALGSIIPIIVTIYGYVILYTKLGGHVFSNMLVLIKPYNFVFQISLALLIIGAIVGMFGSVKAVRKYLKI